MNNTFLVFLLALVGGMVLSSCLNISTVTPYDHGYAIGTAIYAGYSRIADKRSPEFREAVAKVWAKVNEIEDTDHLASDLADILAEFELAADIEGLTPAEKATLANLSKLVLGKVDEKLSEEAMGHEDAVEFLEGVRDGINAMIALEEQYK